MAECRDFFDEPTSTTRRSSSLGNKPSIPTPTEGMEEVGEHCLELTLGLGPSSVGGVQASCPLQVRPASVYTCLPKQPSGNFASSVPFVPTSDVSQTSFSHVDVPKGLQNLSGEAEVTVLAKQRSGNFAFSGTHTHPGFGGQADKGLAVKALFPSGDTAFPSRDQIWLALQKNGAVSRQDSEHPNEASSIWGRRSSSMHVMIPRKDVGDAENDQIRRSCSSGVFPLTVSRQMSSIESSHEKSPQQNMMCSQDHDQEALEDLRKRKELQAQRRQVARKRRKILIEEKQHKKSKQSSSLQRLGSRQSISPNDKFSLGGTNTSEDGVTQESHCASPDALKNEGQGMVRKGMQMIQNSHTEETKQEILSQCAKEDKMDMLVGSVEEFEGPSHLIQSKGGMSMHRYNTTCSMPIKDGPLNGLSHEHNSGSLSSMMTTEFEQPISVGNNKFLTKGNEHNHGSLPNSHAVTVMSVHTGARMNEDEGGKSSETECVESSSIQNNAKLLKCTSEKGGVGAMVSSALLTAPLSSNSMSYPPFPFLAVPYPYTVAAATPTAIPGQPGFPFPFLVQYPSHCDNTVSPLHGTCSIVSGATLGTSLPGALIPNLNSVNKDCMGESFEGKGGCGEKPAFTPLPRTASTNLQPLKEEPQCVSGQLESQVTFPVSQLSSLSSVMSDACNTKNLLLERQQSVAIGGRLLSQNSNAQDQSTLSSKQEGPTRTQRGFDVQHETFTLRVGSEVEVKQVERVKVEEGNVESQLGGELAGVDTSNVQSGSFERQKSGSFSDLPWVTTTGKGPNGKTINGVLYIVNGQRVRLVCSCHGKHMSPAEFVEHSGSTDLSNPERSIVVCPSPSLNHQLASAPV